MSARSILRVLFIGTLVTVGISYLTSLVNDWRWGRVISPVTVLSAPYLHTGDHVAKTVFRPGETVFVHVTTRRSLPCFAAIHQRVISFANGDRRRPTIWQNLGESNGWTEPGTFESDYRFRTPDDVPPGQYFYERTITYECGLAGSVRQAQPLIPFEVMGN